MPEQIDMKSINEGLALMLAKELHDYCLEAEQQFCGKPANDFFLPFQQQRVVEIGRSLNSIGGWNLMSAVCGILPNYSQTCVDVLWSGIGSWLR